MTLNRELFAKDPLAYSLPNDGVAKILQPQSDEQWKTLRYELENFVCEGMYERGLDQILTSYLANLGTGTQPAAWVSGFYGCGKSHFVRVLEYLWRGTQLQGGASVRDICNLPADIKDQFTELTLQSRKYGGLWSAAGVMDANANDSIRLALLEIVFRSAGLPIRYPMAKFVLWLRKEGYYDAVRKSVEASGKVFDEEIQQLFVSPVIADSLLKANPDFAETGAKARGLFKSQYPNVTDITDDEMVNTLKEVLALQSDTPGKLPCTLIILDELQQFIANDPTRTLRVQHVVEACSAQFDGTILFVATGQAALQGDAQLSKLQGRFTVQVLLSDVDVERVVRQVVLLKASDKKAELQEVLDENSGEIDRQLQGSKIGPTDDDRQYLVPDYPLLPARRRFWERILRAVDRQGAAGQLRTQLKTVYEATREVANEPIGTVVAGDRIFDQLRSDMSRSGILGREMDNIIIQERDGSPEGEMRSRLCAAIFLIGQLPHDPGADAGVRATKEMLADLLVDDLPAGSGKLRQQIPDLLDELAEKSSLMLVGDEYRLQTRESAAWHQDFGSRQSTILHDDARISSDRITAFRAACNEELQITLNQGNSKVTRKTALVFSSEAPTASNGVVPIWVRDAWSDSIENVREEARTAGAESATVIVFLPNRSDNDLRKALAASAAATETLNARANPSTQEGREAKAAMESRLQEQNRLIDSIIFRILKDASVFQGGGTEVNEKDLRSSVVAAVETSLVRMYPNFGMADDPRWGKVTERVRQGNADALSVLEYQGDANQHPVCAAIAREVGGAGKKGSDIRKYFSASPFGWPQDAIDGALLVLVADGQMTAAQNGTALTARQIDNLKLNSTDFRLEGITISTGQRIAVRKLLANAEIPYKTDEEAQALSTYITNMIALSKTAGGDMPIPAPPSPVVLEELKALSGNALILAVCEKKDELETLRIKWQSIAQTIAARLPRWQILQRLLAHAQGLPIHNSIAPQVEAINNNRELLQDPDPVVSLCRQLTDDLRDTLQAALKQFNSTFDAQLKRLEDNASWSKLKENEKQEILHAQGLSAPAMPKLSTEADLLAALDNTTIHAWQDKTAAINERVVQASLEAAKRLEPKTVSVHLPSANLKTIEDVDAYLAQARAKILEHIEAGNPVVI